MGVDMGSVGDVLIERSDKMEYLAMGDVASNKCPLLCHVKSKARVDFSAKRRVFVRTFPSISYADDCVD